MDFFGFLRRPGRPQPSQAGATGPTASPPQRSAADEVAREDSGHAPVPVLPTPPTTPQEVRRLLFDAIASGDESRLHALCKEHEDLIVQHSAAWLEVPPEFRTSPELYEWYGSGLRAISDFCAQRATHHPLAADTARVLDPHRA